LYLVRTTKGEIFEQVREAISQKYPGLKVKEGIIGPVVGTHVGSTACAILFEGALRLDIS